MSELTAEPADAADPWSEARPPHLPDRLTAVSWLAWPFVALALVLVVVAWPRVQDVFAPGGFSIARLLEELEGAAIALLGAALFWRHPDALRTLPRVFVGVTLLAAREILRAASPALEGAFATLTPAPEAFPFFVPLNTAYSAFATLVGLFGLVYLARGLSEARRFEDRGSSRPATAAVVVLALLLTAAQLSTIGDLPADASMTVGMLVAVSLGLTALNLLAWGYLTLTVGRGWLGGEAPARGWLAVTAAGVCLFLSSIVLAALNWVAIAPSDGVLVVVQLASLIRIAAFVLLLVALATGLPSTDQVEWVDADEAPVGDEPTLDPSEVPSPGSARS